MRGGGEELQQGIAFADFMQAGAERGDGLVVRVQQAPLRQQRVHERIPDRAFDRLTKIGARDQEGVDVDPVGIEREAGPLEFLVVDGHQNEVDIGFCPDGVVGEAPAENGGENGAVLTDLRHEIVERRGEFLADGLGRLGVHSALATSTAKV